LRSASKQNELDTLADLEKDYSEIIDPILLHRAAKRQKKEANRAEPNE